MHTVVEDCHNDLYLLNHVGSLFRGSLSTCFASQPGAHCPLPQVAPNTASAVIWLWLQLADHDWLWLTVYTCMYNFITPTHSSSSWFTWSASACQPMQTVFLFTQLENPVRNPWLTALSKVNMQHIYTILQFAKNC